MSKFQKLPRGVYERGSGFRVSVMVKGQRRTGSCATLEEAEILAARFRSGRLEDAPAEILVPWTYPETVERVVEDHVKVNSTSPKGVSSRSSQMRIIGEIMAEIVGGPDVPMDATTQAHIEALRRRLRVGQGYSINYANALLSCLRVLHGHARRMGHMTTRLEIKNVPGKQGRVRFVTEDEERAMLDWCRHTGHDELRDTIILLIDTGLRIGEACDLEFRDVDLDARRIDIWRSKSAKPRSVGLTGRVIHMVRNRKLKAASFYNPSKVLAGHTQFTVRDYWQKMREGLGLADDKQFVPHCLRHTCATRLVSRGVDLRTVKDWLGHSDIRTTMGYAQFIPANLFNAASVLEQPAPGANALHQTV